MSAMASRAARIVLLAHMETWRLPQIVLIAEPELTLMLVVRVPLKPVWTALGAHTVEVLLPPRG